MITALPPASTPPRTTTLVAALAALPAASLVGVLDGIVGGAAGGGGATARGRGGGGSGMNPAAMLSSARTATSSSAATSTWWLDSGKSSTCKKACVCVSVCTRVCGGGGWGEVGVEKTERRAWNGSRPQCTFRTRQRARQPTSHRRCRASTQPPKQNNLFPPPLCTQQNTATNPKPVVPACLEGKVHRGSHSVGGLV